MRTKNLLWVGVAVCLLALVPMTMAGGKGNPNPAIVPIQASPNGQSYSQWAEAWWTWAAGIPQAVNPLLDHTGALAATNQSGKVFFLAGSSNSDVYDRTVTVKPGTSLFLPVINSTWWASDNYTGDLETACFFAGIDPALIPTMTMEEQDELLHYIAAVSIDQPYELTLTIDGKAVKDLESYRAATDIFMIDNKVYFSDQGFLMEDSTRFAADGYWVFLTPLSAGSHTIHLTGSLTSGPFAGFFVDVTYHLTVGK